MANKGELLVFVINVGVSSKDSQSNPVLLDKTKTFIQRLVEKKIFYRPNDEIGLLLYGSTTTFNENNFQNIQEIRNSSECAVQMPNWDLIRFISDLELTDSVSNWIEALYVAINLVKRESTNSEGRSRLIVLFSDFKQVPEIIPFNEKKIISELKEQNIKLIAIGFKSLHNLPEDTVTFGESLIIDICKQANGMYRTINKACNDAKFITKTQSKLMPWSCNLELHDVQIPIKSYVKVTKEARFPSWKLVTDKTSESKTVEPDEFINVKRVKEYQGRRREFHNAEDAMYGYYYGGIPTPFSKVHENAMMYKSGPTSYRFLCFTKTKRVGMQYWSSSTSNRIVIPANKNVAPKFYSLMEAMNKKHYVAIVRKVYRANCKPNIVALFPRMNIPDEPWCFVEIILPYAEDIRVIESKPLTSFVKKLSEEQNDAVDNLLDAFMLTDISDSSMKKKKKPFMPGCIPNPIKQNTFNMISYRALNPEKPLPHIDVELKKLLEPYQEIIEKSADSIEEIQKLFDFPECC